MKIAVLISCMFKDVDIIKETNIQSDVIVINQCDKEDEFHFSFENSKGEQCNAVFVNTTERGLSRSRNMAIEKAQEADICLVCDDDERLDDDYPEKIERAYRQNTDKEVITFIVSYRKKLFGKKPRKMGVIDICRTSSVQITFLRSAIINKNIKFDVMMGSGSGNGAGEENKFLMDCRRSGLNLFYFPYHIGSVISYESKWNNGYTKKYFLDRGWTMRRSFGFLYGYMFLWYNVLHNRKIFTKDGVSFKKILIYLHQGFLEDRNDYSKCR